MAWQRIPGAYGIGAPRASLAECLIAGLFAVLSLLSYQQLAAPHCLGQPHTLPPDSAILHGYPCNGSCITRMLYILKHSPFVLWDFCWVKFEDIWAASGLFMIFLRFFCAPLAPYAFYSQVIAPFTMYYARFVNTTFHVLQGPRYKPSYLGIQSLFRKHAPFDVAFFLSLLGVWRVNMALELVYCAWSTVATAVLWHWYRDLIPDISLLSQMLTRLLVVLANVFLDRLLHRRHRRRCLSAAGCTSAVANASATASATAGKTGGSGTMGKTAAAAGKVAEIDSGQVKESGHDDLLPQLASGSGTCDACTGLQTSAKGRSARSTSQTSLKYLKYSSIGPLPPPLHPATAATAAATTAVSIPSKPAVQESSCISVTTTSNALTGKGPAAAAIDMTSPIAERDGIGAGPAFQQLSYRSPVQRRAIRMKIPWAEPEQMAPQFEQRLQTLAAERGLQLSAVFVRRGCVELMLVLEGLERPLPLPDQDRCPRDSEPRGRGLPLANPNPNSSSITTTTAIIWDLDSAALLEAVGLGQDMKPGRSGLSKGRACSSSSSRSSSFESQQQQRLLVQSVERVDEEVLIREAGVCRLGPEGGGGEVEEHIRATGLEPRVLLLSPPSATLPATASILPIMRLTVTITGPRPEMPLAAHRQRQQVETDNEVEGPQQEQQRQVDEVEVLARTSNTQLPIRVTMIKVTDVDSSSAPLSLSPPVHEYEHRCEHRYEHRYEHTYEYYIELLSPPPRPGVVLLELRYRRCKQNAAATAPGVETRLAGAPAERWLRVILPLVATYDAHIAEDLTAAAAAWPAESVRELDELLYDMGTWLAAAEAVVESGGGDAGADGSGSIAAALGMHLLSYAESAGWEATAAGIRRAQKGMVRASGGKGCAHKDRASAVRHDAAAARHLEASSTAFVAFSPSGVASGGGALDSDLHLVGVDGDVGEGGIDPWVISDSRCGIKGAGSWRRGQRCLLGPLFPRPGLLSALERAMGLRACAPAERAAFQAFADAWTDGLGHIPHVVECLVLFCILARGLRAGQQPLGPEHAVALVGCGMGALATLAWLALPYGAWVRLVRASKVPRLLGFCASKAMLLVGLRSPLGAAAYAGGPGMLLLEGFILPVACMVSPRTAFLVACFKLPLNYKCVLVLGAARRRVFALLIATLVEVAALTTTLICHLYLRCRFECQYQAMATAAPAVKAAVTAGALGSGLAPGVRGVGGVGDQRLGVKGGKAE